VAVIAGFLYSTTAGIAVLVFFVAYQQLENHLLQPLIFARTVKLDPLTVIVAILLGSNSWACSVRCWRSRSPA
jgi:predicted PurR-regulated permease PerM